MDALGTTRYTMPLVLASMLLVAITESVQLLPGMRDTAHSQQASLVSLGNGSPTIEIRRFQGTRNGRNIILEWTTQRESDLLQFEIQRASSQSRGWERISTVAAGNGSLPRTYTYFDRNAPAEDVRYLLRIHGRNNEILYSDIVVVPLAGIIRSFTVMPEPTGRVNSYILSVGTSKHADISLTLATTSGQTIEKIFGPSDIGVGEHTFNIDCSKHAAGDYVVRLKTPDGDFQRGLILGR